MQIRIQTKGVLTVIGDRDNFCIPLFIPCGFKLITVLPTALGLLILRNLVQCKLLISAGKNSEINYIIIHSKYFPNSDWLKAHV